MRRTRDTTSSPRIFPQKMGGDEVARDKNIVFEMSPHLLAEILRERIATVLF